MKSDKKRFCFTTAKLYSYLIHYYFIILFYSCRRIRGNRRKLVRHAVLRFANFLKIVLINIYLFLLTQKYPFNRGFLYFRNLYIFNGLSSQTVLRNIERTIKTYYVKITLEYAKIKFYIFIVDILKRVSYNVWYDSSVEITHGLVKTRSYSSYQNCILQPIRK